MKKSVKKISLIAAVILALAVFISNIAMAKPVEISPHIFIDEVEPDDWYLNDIKSIIFVGYGSPTA